MRWTRHVASVGDWRGAYGVLVGRRQGKRPLGRRRRRRWGNIKMYVCSTSVMEGHGPECSGSWEEQVEALVNSFIHPVVCLTTGPKPLPKRSLHILRSKASSFKWQYPLLSLRASSSFLRLLTCLLVTSSSPFIFPSITCFRRQFLRKMWPIQLAFSFHISRRIFYSAHWL